MFSKLKALDAREEWDENFRKELVEIYRKQ